MSFFGMDFGFPEQEPVPVEPLKSRYYMEFEVPLSNITPELLRILLGDDGYAQMWREQHELGRWEDDGGAYL